MANNEILKPCPFCGGKATVTVILTADKRNVAFVECNVCGATSKAYALGNEAKIDEIADDEGVESACFAWNRRA